MPTAHSRMNLSTIVSHLVAILHKYVAVFSDVSEENLEHSSWSCLQGLSGLCLGGSMQHAHIHVYHPGNSQRYILHMFPEIMSPKHARCNVFCNAIFVWFLLAALHSTSTNRMCYLSYQRACHYNAYPAQNGWQSLEQDTNTQLNNTLIEKQVHERLKIHR